MEGPSGLLAAAPNRRSGSSAFPVLVLLVGRLRAALAGGGVLHAAGRPLARRGGLRLAAAAAASAPNLLGYVRRFRYVEACAADVELARVLCLNYMQGSQAP
mmetsp:Transcript_142617/g.443582  ORF Transcript_142617/g.443582 Transcript_142617/m.443582 type:complete len:102 (-) Transcript_142617:416-721(-)